MNGGSGKTLAACALFTEYVRGKVGRLSGGRREGAKLLAGRMLGCVGNKKKNVCHGQS